MLCASSVSRVCNCSSKASSSLCMAVNTPHMPPARRMGSVAVARMPQRAARSRQGSSIGERAKEARKYARCSRHAWPAAPQPSARSGCTESTSPSR
jgi:hypothetical protein